MLLLHILCYDIKKKNVKAMDYFWTYLGIYRHTIFGRGAFATCFFAQIKTIFEQKKKKL